MDTEAQFRQDIISALLAMLRGEEPPGVTIIDADSDIELVAALSGLPERFTYEDLAAALQGPMAAATAQVGQQAKAAVDFLSSLVLALAAEYQQACPEADPAAFIRDFAPRPQLRAVGGHGTLRPPAEQP